jgi:hypothetical protein
VGAFLHSPGGGTHEGGLPPAIDMLSVFMTPWIKPTMAQRRCNLVQSIDRLKHQLADTTATPQPTSTSVSATTTTDPPPRLNEAPALRQRHQDS